MTRIMTTIQRTYVKIQHETTRHTTHPSISQTFLPGGNSVISLSGKLVFSTTPSSYKIPIFQTVIPLVPPLFLELTDALVITPSYTWFLSNVTPTRRPTVGVSSDEEAAVSAGRKGKVAVSSRSASMPSPHMMRNTGPLSRLFSFSINAAASVSLLLLLVFFTCFSILPSKMSQRILTIRPCTGLNSYRSHENPTG